MRQAPFLKKGDTIAITCPSGFIAKETILKAKENLENWGYHVVIGNTVGESDNYFSAPDDVKVADLQAFLDDEHISAIIMGRGGYGMSRIIDQLDFSKFILNPKWICGFSDITVIHSHLQSNFGIASIHSPMCGSFTKELMKKDFMKCFKNMLRGQALQYPIHPNPNNVTGHAKGILIGGNLAMLAHLSGSVSAPNAHGKILFIEDIGEHLYNIDRMLYNLKRSGVFDRLIGVICGGFTDLQDTTRPFGQDIYQILSAHFNHLGIPVVYDFPSGHIEENYPIMLGGIYEMNVGTEEVIVRYQPA